MAEAAEPLLHTQPQLLLPQDTVMQAAENETCARAWKLSALFSMDAHPDIYDSRMQMLPEYVRGLLLNLFQSMRNKEKTMRSVSLLSFIMPRAVQNRRDVPVIVILHATHVLGQSTVEALLNRTIGVTVTCMPLDFGPGKKHPEVTSHPIYTFFLSLSSKDTGPDVDANLYLRVDIHGNSDAMQETIATLEEKYLAWKFTATFDPSFHPDLVQVVNDRCQVSEDYIVGLLNQTIVQRLAHFSFTVPEKISCLSNHTAVHVTGMLRSRTTQLRRRTVEVIFPKCAGLTLHFMPLQAGRGFLVTSHPEFTEYLDTSSTDRAETEDAGANPNLLFRVNVRDETDDAQPRKRGPRPGSSRHREPLDSDLNSLLSPEAYFEDLAVCYLSSALRPRRNLLGFAWNQL